jgi:hypothetical protein
MEKQLQFPKTLRVMADYGSSGIWVVEPVGPFRHGMIEHQDLRLPPDLARRFTAWINDYWQARDSQFDKSKFITVGRELARELKAFVGTGVRVFYAAEDNIRRDDEIFV